MALPSTNFVGALDGITVYEINKKIDYTKTHLEERKEVINSILEGSNFYNEYFDGYFKSGITASENLSLNNNVCKSLERMANYLLNSKEIKQEEDKEKQEYVFYTDQEAFEKRMAKELSLESVAINNGEDSVDSAIHFLKRPEGNSKKSKNQCITSKDEKREDFLGEVIRSYRMLEKYLVDELKSKESKYNRYLISKIKRDISQDMIASKDDLLGVFGYELKSFYESTKYDLNVFDFTNEAHLKGCILETYRGNRIMVKGLLYFKPNFDPNNEMSFILMDLQNTIEKANLTYLEKEILDCLRSGLTQQETANELEICQRKVSRYIDGIIKKIIKVGNTYDKKVEEN